MAPDSEKAVYSKLLPAIDERNDSSSLSSVDGEDTTNVLFQPSSKADWHRRPLNRLLAFLAKAIPLLCATWALFFLASWTISSLRASNSMDSWEHQQHQQHQQHQHQHQEQHQQQPLSCSCGGTTIADAKARGCKFTQLAIAWLPPHCLDQELSDEFDRAGPEADGGWPYWADLNGTIPMTLDEISLLADKEGGVFYTTQEWHIRHCMFTWRKHYRSQFTGVTIENRSNGLKHIAHCEKVMLDRAPLQKIWTMAGIELNADLI